MIHKSTRLIKLAMVSLFSWRCRLSSAGDLHRYAVICNPRFFANKTVHIESICGVDEGKSKNRDAGRREAQTALLEYLHLTRSLRYSDAENMSMNAPFFLSKLLDKIDVGMEGVGQSTMRFLRYHPINEFEPFLESLGLRPKEIGPLLPPNRLFLSDDDLMLYNYYALCDFGIPRNKIGKIYENAPEVFHYERGILVSKLPSCLDLGFSSSFIPRLIAYSPYLFVDRVFGDLVKVIGVAKKIGIEMAWIEDQLSECSIYNWSQMRVVINLFMDNGCNDQLLNLLIREHLQIMLRPSGYSTLSVIGFLLKFGLTVGQICVKFMHFPKMSTEKFVLNVRRCFSVFMDIEMQADTIAQMFQSHLMLLGSCKLKKTNSLICGLRVGKTRIREVILNDPEILRKWVIGTPIDRLPKFERGKRSKNMRIKFLVDVGFVKNSAKMEEALKYLRGAVSDLEGRFNCIVKAGLSEEDVKSMVKRAPQLLNQKINVLESKINVLVHECKYPVTTLTSFPSCLGYSSRRIRLRLSMCNWLRNNKSGKRLSSLSCEVSCSEKSFLFKYVRDIPGALEIWKDLKKEVYLN